jgi:hypothetical protein
VKRTEGAEIWLRSFLTKTLDGVVRFTPRPLYPRRKSPQYPIFSRPGGRHSQPGRFDTSLWPLPGIEPRIVQSITCLLCRLCYAIPAYRVSQTGSKSARVLGKHSWRRVGKWRYVTRILNLGTRRRVASFTPWLFYSWGNTARYPWNRLLLDNTGTWSFI